MPPRRGRPPKPKARLPPSPPLSEAAKAFEFLYRQDTSTVACALCEQAVPSIREHLAEAHPTIRYEEYRQEYPGAPLEGTSNPDERQTITITEDEIREHPCGRDGVLIEKALAEEERPHFRADIKAILANGYPASYEVAALAHLMTMARRTRITIEATRETTKGVLFPSESLDLLHDLEEKIAKSRMALEKIRSSRTREEFEDPHVLLEAEQRAAEQWVRAHIGEHQTGCPGCGMMLTPPALPHWAFEPSKDDRGNLYWPVWSPELWGMVLDRTIPLWVMAYTLRTAPEGLRLTARRRQEEWPSWIDIEREEQQLRTRLIADDRAYVVPVSARKGETNGSTG